jgi:hypothetical protein
MPERTPKSFNPARFVDQITESLYATGLGTGTKLKNGRQRLAAEEVQGRPAVPNPGRQAPLLQAAGPLQVASLPRVRLRGQAAAHDHYKEVSRRPVQGR